MKNLKQGSYIKIILDEADKYATKNSTRLKIDEVVKELKRSLMN
ncbi:hypothetical protein [Lagierella massiliensis]|nr:hypothetical protein [Lagierella massiliensis]